MVMYTNFLQQIGSLELLSSKRFSNWNEKKDKKISEICMDNYDYNYKHE